MKRKTLAIRFSILLTAFMLLTQHTVAAPHDDPASGIEFASLQAGKIVVANRASGDISIINVETDQVLSNISLPGPAAEPMYVVYTQAGNRVFVGDRANNQVVAFDADDFSVEGTVSVGAGVFHMWANPQGNQLWVNNDIDNTASVINPWTLNVIKTVPMPADLVSLGGKPHDVVLDTRSAYVTMVGLAGDDYVVKFSQRTFEEIARTPVGKDPHVSLTLRNQLLYVPSQGGNAVFALNRKTMQPVTDIPVPGAHGAGMTRKGKTFYTTNLPGAGVDGLVTIDTRTNSVVGTPVNTPYPVPHNIALTPNGRKLYVTHSGAAANNVSVYTTDKQDVIPILFSDVTVGFNPFGLSFVP